MNAINWMDTTRYHYYHLIFSGYIVYTIFSQDQMRRIVKLKISSMPTNEYNYNHIVYGQLTRCDQYKFSMHATIQLNISFYSIIWRK